MKLRRAGLILTGLLLMGSFQNCGHPYRSFAIEQGSGGEPAPGTPVDQNAFPAGVTVSDKAIGDASVTKVIEWDLTSDVSTGQPLADAKFQISVTKFAPADGSPDVYYITKPTLISADRALRLKNFYVRINGETDSLGTTFSGLDVVVGERKAEVLSNATLIHQLTGAATAQNTIGVFFEVLWPNDVPLPSGNGGSVTGEALYAANCAGCHGAGSGTTKPGRTSAQIAASLTDVSQMQFLQPRLSTADIDALAVYLRR